MITGQDLQVARIIKGLSQYKVAAKLGIPAPKLSEIEHGKCQLSSEMVERILVAIDELTGGVRMK